MTRAELLASHFARCFQEYRGLSPDEQAVVVRLATTAADHDITQAVRTDAISSLAGILFPDGAEGIGFGGRVARLLRLKGMNQRALARAMCVTEPAVSRILSGRHRPRRQTVNRLAEALGVRPDEL